MTREQLDEAVVVKFKRLDEDAQIPLQATQGSAGFDFYSNESKRIYPGETVRVRTGLAMEIPPGYECQVRSRSGLAEDGVVVANSPGTIDSDYRGPCDVLLRNNGAYATAISKGERIAQGVIQRVPQVIFDVVEELSSTKRGEGGFGSTGR